MDITQYLEFAVKQHASDLHITAGGPPMIRVDGDIRKLNVPPLSSRETFDLIYDVMEDNQRRILEEHLDHDFAFEIPGLSRFRVNVFHKLGGLGGAFRILPKNVPELDQLQAPDIFKDLALHPRGLILVTGGTGSGKSTLMAAMLNHVNDNRFAHILTLEDPIEFVHKGRKCLISQREVGPHATGYARALRASLREDPDVILVGEMRDTETIRLALTAAETGHLVMATLHTSSAAKTMDRIVDVFPTGEKEMARTMLAESLQAVISMALLKRVGGGRIAAHEIMIATPAVRNLVREAKAPQLYSAISTSAQHGMQTMDQCLQKLLRAKVINEETARYLAINKTGF